MKSMRHCNATDFSLERVMQLKGGKRIFVVFSTYGEREADLVHRKISLLREETADCIDRIMLSHRRMGLESDRTEKRALDAYGDVEIVLCNELSVPDMGDERGKGADMRRTLYHINRRYCEGDGCIDGGDIILVFLDADVHEEYFGSHFVLGLAGAVLEGNDFAKAGFWRAMGRVKKYVAQPLFSMIRHESLDGLAAFSYPLSGEVGGTVRFFNGVSFWQMYGVETGICIDSVMGDYRVADVNLGLYDHEHHGEINIQKMAFGIIRTYLQQLIDYGILSLHGACVSDSFRAGYIDENGSRGGFDFDLGEQKYRPLVEILRSVN